MVSSSYSSEMNEEVLEAVEAVDAVEEVEVDDALDDGASTVAGDPGLVGDSDTGGGGEVDLNLN